MKRIIPWVVATACFSKPPQPVGEVVAADAPLAPDAPPVVPPQVTEPPISPTATQRLVAGGAHGCAIDSGKKLHCWGDNRELQLGTRGIEIGPSAVVQAEIWEDVGAGNAHTCGLRNKQVYCWGSAWVRQAGGNGTISPLEIRQITLRTGFVPARLSVSGDLSCAHDAGNATVCWGRVDPTAATSVEVGATTPLLTISGQTRWLKVVGTRAAGGHVCALAETGAVYCWGGNNHGLLGRGNTVDERIAMASATPVVGNHLFADIAVNETNSCGVTRTGELWCWGQETERLFMEDQGTPVRIGNDSNWAEIDMGLGYACARKNTGQVFCGGRHYWGAAGEALNSARWTTNRVLPTEIALAAPAVSLVAGNNHTCVRTNKGETYCWGSNAVGQLGDGRRSTWATPQAATLPMGFAGAFTDISAGTNHTCATYANNGNLGLLCWGQNFAGQVRPAALQEEVVATPFGLMQNVAQLLQAGGSTSCIATAQHKFSCWGAKAVVDATAPVGGLWRGLAVTSDTICARASQTSCWGRNLPSYNSGTAVPRSGETWERMAMGSEFAVGVGKPTAADTTTSIIGFGVNTAGVLGVGANTSAARVVFTPVALLAKPISGIAAATGGAHACIWSTESAAVECWGDNDDEQGSFSLGDTVVQVSLGGHHSCALDKASQLTCWGDLDELAQTTKDIEGTWFRIATGFNHACAITSDQKEIKCWGRGEYGQLGNGTSASSAPRRASVPL